MKVQIKNGDRVVASGAGNGMNQATCALFDKLYQRAMDAKTSVGVQGRVKEMEVALRDVGNKLSAKKRNYCNSRLEIAQKHMKELARQEQRTREEKVEKSSQLEADKAMRRICDGLERPASIKALVKAMDYAQAELPHVKTWNLSSYYAYKYRMLSGLSDQYRAECYNKRIRIEFDAISKSAVSEIKSVEDFASELSRLFRQVDDVRQALPKETNDLVEELKQKVGLE